MPVQTVDQSLDRGFVQMTNIASRLSRFLTGNEGLWVDGSESVNHDFTTNRLDGVDNDGDRSGV